MTCTLLLGAKRNKKITYVTVAPNSNNNNVFHDREPLGGTAFFIDSGEQSNKFADDTVGDNDGENDAGPKLTRLLIICLYNTTAFLSKLCHGF